MGIMTLEKAQGGGEAERQDLKNEIPAAQKEGQELVELLIDGHE